MTVLETERKNLKTLSDEELVKAAQSGDNEALEAILSRYKNLVYAKSKPYFLAGADDDDIIQEGLIGLYKAVMDFDGDRFPFFKVFAGVCVTRHIITAVKAASRKKHLPLNSYVSLDKNTYDDDSDTTLLDIIAFSELQDPEAILIDRENMDGMEYKINKVLSKLETEVLVYYLEGLSYQEIAEKLGKDTKAVDNAVQRIKKKLESTLREGNEVKTMYEDKTLVCKDCGKEFTFSAGEQEFYAEKGFENEPQRCKECRQARKNSMRQNKEMYEIVCASCGKVDKVPFEPRNDKPVYCSECFAKQNN